MLDTYAHEYDEMIKKQNAHAIEVDALRTSNRNLSTQVSVPVSSTIGNSDVDFHVVIP